MTTINRAPWTALVDDSGQNLDGSIWNKAAIQGVLLDPIDAALATLDAKDALITTGAWTPYAVSWVGPDGIGPTLGNGFALGRYALMGKTCHVLVNLKLGTTSTIGSSTYWIFGLPFAVHASGPPIALTAGFLNAAGSPFAGATSYAFSPTQVLLVTAAGGYVSPNAPFAWVTNCQLFIRGSYEVA